MQSDRMLAVTSEFSGLHSKCPAVGFYPKDDDDLGVVVTREEYQGLPSGTVFLQRLGSEEVQRTILASCIIGFQICQLNEELGQIAFHYVEDGEVNRFIVAHFRYQDHIEESLLWLHGIVSKLNLYYCPLS